MRHWRTYSLTSLPGRGDGRIAITVKAIPDGVVSNQLVRNTRPGDVVRLAPPTGEYVLPDPLPARILFVTAGSGITPVAGMLRDLADRGALSNVVHVHLSPTRDDAIFGDELRRLANRHGAMRYLLHEHHDDAHGLFTVARLTQLVRDIPKRDTWACGPAGLLDALTEHWTTTLNRPDQLNVERFRPVVAAVSGEGGTVKFTHSGKQVEADGATPILVAGEEAGAILPSGCRMGICNSCVGRLTAGAVRDLQDRRDPARRGPDGEDLLLRRGGPSRDRTLKGTRMTANPLDHLTPADLDAIGAELDAIRDEVMADLGEEDAAYIRSVIKTQRTLEAGGRAALLVSLFPPAWMVGTAALSVAKILENMEIGHNVMHGQWDWMRDPEIHSSTWEWDNVSSAAGWKHSHNFQHHTFTNVVGKDRDLGYEIMRIDPAQRWKPIYLAQPFYNVALALAFQWGVALHDVEFDEVRRGKKPWEEAKADLMRMLGKARRQVVKDYVLWPVLSGPSAVPSFFGSLTANLVRNVWSHAVIFCGHFPDGTETFEYKEEQLDERDPRRLVRAPAHGLGQPRRLAAVPRHGRQPLLPDRAPPLPGPAEQPLPGDLPAGARDLRALRPALHVRPALQAVRAGAGEDRALCVAGWGNVGGRGRGRGRNINCVRRRAPAQGRRCLKRERELEPGGWVVQHPVAERLAQAVEPVADGLGVDVEHLGRDRDVAVRVEPGAQRRLGPLAPAGRHVLQRGEPAGDQVVGQPRARDEQQGEQMVVGVRERVVAEPAGRVHRPAEECPLNRRVGVLPRHRVAEHGAALAEPGA